MQIPARMRKQEFTAPIPTFEVRIATTVNGTLATAFDNASVVDGVTLATNDLILLKNQSTQSDNGVYIVQAAGAPVRHSSYDSAIKLNGARVKVTAGNQNSGSYWYQTATLTSLSDNQTWAITSLAQKWTVPDGVTEIEIEASGGGGGGGAAGGSSSATSGTSGGGAGGGGGPIQKIKQAVTPGDVLSIIVGGQGLKGVAVTNGVGSTGAAGGSSVVSGTGWTFTFFGGGGGGGGGTSVGVNDSLSGTMAGGGTDYATFWGKYGAAGVHSGLTGISGHGPGGGGGASFGNGGDGGYAATALPGSGAPMGGGGGAGSSSGNAAEVGGNSIYASGGAGGVTRGGGGGGASWGAGAAGGSGTAIAGNSASDNTAGGGGGGSGRTASAGAGGHGGNGGTGKVILYWVE